MKISLIHILSHGGYPAESQTFSYPSGVDEVVYVHDASVIPAAKALPFRSVPAKKGIVRAINAAASKCRGVWILFAFDGELPENLDISFLHAQGADALAVHMIHPPLGEGLPIVCANRMAFLYGAVDERFPSVRLSLLHWVYEVFPAAGWRKLPCEGVQNHERQLPDTAWQDVDHPVAGAVALWSNLSPFCKSRLLNAALGNEAALTADLTALMARESQTAENLKNRPYHNQGYSPRDFWEKNTRSYVKWEIYQPDEPEIEEMVSRTSPRSVLELGCGVGRNTRYFSNAARYVGLDIAMPLLDKAAERQEENSLGVVLGDATCLPVRDSSFDMIFAVSTIQHVTPNLIATCVADMVRASSRYICLIEFTDELVENGTWFSQSHMFKHDYAQLFSGSCDLVYAKEIALLSQPARKHLFLFEKRDRA